MDNTNTAKGIIASALFVVSYLYNAVGLLFVILLIFMALDYITGLCNALILKKANSRTGLLGIIKKLCYIALLCLSFLLDLAIGDTLSSLNMNLPLESFFGILVTCWLLGNEALSVLENLESIGVPIPLFLKRGIRAYTDSVTPNSVQEAENE